MCAGSDSWAVSTNNRNLLAWVDRLRAATGTLRTLATLAATLLLWEESGDPGGVDEVASAAERAEEDEVEEDAIAGVSDCQRTCQ